MCRNFRLTNSVIRMAEREPSANNPVLATLKTKTCQARRDVEYNPSITAALVQEHFEKKPFQLKPCLK